MLKKNNKIVIFIYLHLLLLFVSFGPVFSKLASNYDFLSLKFILFYGIMMVIVGIYAVFWQQIIKRIPLTTAFCNKAVNIIWGIVWGTLLFKETIKINMIIGAVIVIVGVIIVVMADE